MSLQDRYWDRLLRYCSDNGSYQGCLLPEPESHVYHEEEQFAVSQDAMQDPTEQYPDQTQWTPEEEHQSDLPKVFPNPCAAQYEKNQDHNSDRSKHTWNADAPSYQPLGSYQTWNIDPDPINPVPPQADNHTSNDADPVNQVPPRVDDPDLYKHTWNVDGDLVNPVQKGEPAGALESEERVFWSDLSEITPTGWDD